MRYGLRVGVVLRGAPAARRELVGDDTVARGGKYTCNPPVACGFSVFFMTDCLWLQNNTLALLFDAGLVEDRGALLTGVVATIGLYVLGLGWEVWALRREKAGGGGSALAAATKAE